jgi:hypothetical protein
MTLVWGEKKGEKGGKGGKENEKVGGGGQTRGGHVEIL